MGKTIRLIFVDRWRVPALASCAEYASSPGRKPRPRMGSNFHPVSERVAGRPIDTDDHRHIAATLELFGGNLPLTHGTDMIEGLQHAKLADAQTRLIGDVLYKAASDGLGSPYELDITAQGSDFRFCSLISIRHLAFQSLQD